MSAASRYLPMARAVQGKPFADWPAWSIGEVLVVALLLNRADVLDSMSYTLCEAFDRVDLDVRQLRAIERELQG